MTTKPPSYSVAPTPAVEPTGKELLQANFDDVAASLDPRTRAELARWFNVPAASPVVVQEPQQPAPALAGIDAAFLAHCERHLVHAREFEPAVFVTLVDITSPTITASHAVASVAFPVRDIPDALLTDLDACTPQALLRDTHRPALYFDKQFELAEGVPGAALAWRPGLPVDARLGATPLYNPRQALNATIAEQRALHAIPWEQQHQIARGDAAATPVVSEVSNG